MEVYLQMAVAFLPAIGGLIVAFFKAFKFVHEGEKGVKLRFGKALMRGGKPRIIEPGFVLLIPFVETLQRRHVRQQTIRFDRQLAMLKNGLIFEVTAAVIFRVNDVYKALFEIENVEQSIEDLSMGILRDELSKHDHKTIVNTDTISGSLLKEIKEKAEEWGITFLQFKITHCAPTVESAIYVNAEVGAKLKVSALAEAVKGDELADSLKRLDPSLASVILGFPLVVTSGQ